MANEVTEGHGLTTALLKHMRKGYNLNDSAQRLVDGTSTATQANNI